MKNGPVIAIVLLVLLTVGSTLRSEYTRIVTAVSETRSKANELADETKATMESIRKTIEELQSKLALLETKMQSEQPQEKPFEQQATESRIVMHSASWCGPCRTWKNSYMPRWIEQGWKVDVIEDDTTTRAVPWFEIYYNGKRFEATGLLDKVLFEKVTR